MDASVKDYLDKLPAPQRQISQRLRQIILKTFPEIAESFKNGVPWYEDKYYIVGLKDHVNLGISIYGLSEEELNLLEGNGKQMRHIKLFSLDDIDEDSLNRYLIDAKEYGRLPDVTGLNTRQILEKLR